MPKKKTARKAKAEVATVYWVRDCNGLRLFKLYATPAELAQALKRLDKGKPARAPHRV